MSWASGGIITTTQYPAAKSLAAWLLKQDQAAARSKPSTKEVQGRQGGGAKHQAGAGQATWGGAGQVPGALDQAQLKASPTLITSH
jgi:hypothetical protein